jgi:two-component system chemotaxis sensor kinase CheA
MPDEMQEIISEFITEAEESLDKIEPLFVELEQKGQDQDMLNDIFRSMHTIKGAAGFLGFQPIVDLAHSSENIMKKLRDGEIPLNKQLMDAILKSVDMLRSLLEQLKEKGSVEEDVSLLVKELETALSASISVENNVEDARASAESVMPAEQETQISDLAENSATVTAGEKHENPPRSADEPKKTPESVRSTESAIQKTQTSSDAALQSKEVESGQKTKETALNLRVDVSRIDKVMDLTGEVVLIRNRLLNISNSYEQKYGRDPYTETLMEVVSFFNRVTSDLQVAVMKMRMQPIKKVFSKFQRLVRDISASVNKEVELQIFGEGTEVDKSVIEHIGDPMTHILRNSIDHGLESTDERIAKGKPPKGRVVINTYQKGNQIIIEVTDDGKGIDIDKLKKKAVEKGLLTEDEILSISDEAATNIIFMPGFSTMETATEISGRGVGMDVVKTNISLLNGYIDILTQKDTGTTFKICIPLTLAIIQALMVEDSGTRYAIPLTPIEETLKVSKQEIDNITGQDVIVIRDRVCPLFELSSLLGTGFNGKLDSDSKYLIVFSMGDKRFCVTVDRLLGQEEIVIKTLDGMDTASSYVLGATITGEGKVVLILDVTGISRNYLDIVKV